MLTQMTTLMCPSNKYSIKSPYAMTPLGICVHNTYGDASAMSEISYMVSNDKEVSFHYAVDDYRSVQGLPEDRNAWHCGATWGNKNLIGVEICYSKSGGDRFTKAESNSAYLIAMLLRKYRWGIEKVQTHQMQSGKYCPHRTLDLGWQRFLNMILSAYDNLYGVKNIAQALIPVIIKYPIAYNAHLVGMGYTDAKVDGEFIGDKDGKVAIDGIHIDTRRLPQGMQLKASVVSGGKLKDYGIINNNTLLGVSNVADKIEQLEFTSINPPNGYDFWYRLYFDGKPMQWTNRKIGTINTNMKLTGLQFRVCKLSELVN